MCCFRGTNFPLIKLFFLSLCLDILSDKTLFCNTLLALKYFNILHCQKALVTYYLIKQWEECETHLTLYTTSVRQCMLGNIKRNPERKVPFTHAVYPWKVQKHFLQDVILVSWLQTDLLASGKAYFLLKLAIVYAVEKESKHGTCKGWHLHLHEMCWEVPTTKSSQHCKWKMFGGNINCHYLSTATEH